MARRGGKRRRHHRAKPSIISLVPLAYIGIRAYEGYKAHGGEGVVTYPISTVSGYDYYSKSFNFMDPLKFYGIVASCWVAKKLVGMSRVNRALKGLPFGL